MSGFSSAVTVILLAMFIYFAYLSGFLSVMTTWTWNTWALFCVAMLISWIARNEFGGK